MKLYQQTKDQVIEDFQVDLQNGLTDEKVTQQREKYGENKLPEKKRTLIGRSFLKTSRNLLSLY
ncbi:hypothetical protein GCM10025857_58880 [Alicyclobacillus contaminans]|uniref:Cation-transporting P-type ATPase N-terminal domain-containing protein n=1 Tax=Tetragenococcus osmophilus TaxID=526944 RepID=A0AA38CYM6_9ENTE|nr:hypothetical protein GCM10025857_58880 [Alicyclobacillus contaminans]GMA71622.1 hypothetical protein GCM10025885_06710 [Tetragenococcus osmophilus]